MIIYVDIDDTICTYLGDRHYPDAVPNSFHTTLKCFSRRRKKMKLSDQAKGALLMTLQKCLAEEKDITELLSEWNLSVKEDLIYVDNPPGVYVETMKQERVFQTE